MSEYKRKELTLEEKIKVIKFIDQGNSERKTVNEFKISKGQVSNIKKRKAEYLELYEDEFAPKDRCRKVRSAEYEEVNQLVWRWFERARAKNIPLSGPIVQEVARGFAKNIGKEDFQASNGWLECFRKRHQIVFQNLHGEAQSADATSASDYISRLPTIIGDYTPENIFNADETGLFYRALPRKSLVEKYKQSKGQKYCKERITILLAASSTGEKLKPLVIGKSQKPRCFKNINVHDLPVTWKANAKSWMKLKLFEEWLQKTNQHFLEQNRKILLFIDNSETHSDIELSNIKVKFLPPNTTSLIQPLDQGIIQNFKTIYRKHFVRYLTSKLDDNINIDEIKIDVLKAIY